MKLSKEFTGNDIYFMEVVGDKIIINDNYKGIYILDNDLNVEKNIKLLDDMIIDTSFKKENEILLCCYENECLIYFRVDTCDYKVIQLSDELKEMSFISLYEWKYDDILLLADNGTIIIQINTINGNISVIPNDIIEKSNFSICNDWSKLDKYIIHNVYPNIFNVIVEIDNRLMLMDYKNNVVTELKIDYIAFHDIEICCDYIIQISENEILINHKDKSVRIYPQQQEESFLRCRFITINEDICIVILIGNNTNSLVGAIERYSIKTDLKL
jgi:hypothetical protein